MKLLQVKSHEELKIFYENPTLSSDKPEELGPEMVKSFSTYEYGAQTDREFWEIYKLRDGSIDIGVCGLYAMNDRNELWIGWLGVLPVFRGYGYGKDMIRSMIARAFYIGARSLYVYCESCRISFYENLGFAVLHTPDDLRRLQEEAGGEEYFCRENFDGAVLQYKCYLPIPIVEV